MLTIRRKYEATVDLPVDEDLLKQCQNEINRLNINYNLTIEVLENIVQSDCPSEAVSNRDALRILTAVERVIRKNAFNIFLWEGFDGFEDKIIKN